MRSHLFKLNNDIIRVEGDILYSFATPTHTCFLIKGEEFYLVTERQSDFEAQITTGYKNLNEAYTDFLNRKEKEHGE